MNTYYVIKNEDGRYLKVRTGSNGTKRAWVEGLKGATVGTLAQCEAIKESLNKSPYYNGLQIVEIGKGHSAWAAKFDAVTELKQKY